MASNYIKVNVHLKWWFTYICIPALIVATFIGRKINKDYEPDLERLDPLIARALVLEVDKS